MKILTYLKLLAVAAFFSFGTAAYAGDGCCPSGKEKSEKDSTEQVPST